MRLVIISNKEWHRRHVPEIEARTGMDVAYISDRDAVAAERLSALDPAYVFFPHWSLYIPPDIYETFPCIVFHMTDLPFGRGGSPLQNLIARGIYETRLSAIRCSREMDAGDVYLKRPLSLWGSAEEIYLRAAELSKEMMIEIATKDIRPVPQEGEAVVFRRRKPEEGDLASLDSLERAFDFIRMLDAETYPPAFLDVGNFHLAFRRAALRDGFLEADVRITLRGNEDGA